MYVEGKYLLVSYRDVPDADFICENGGDLRIRVSKIRESDVVTLPQGQLIGSVDKWILIFENISIQLIHEQEDIVRAVHWYKTKFGLKAMSLLYL
jgi:hypothetical protein